MPYEMKFNIKLYNRMLYNRISIDNRVKRFSYEDNLGQSGRITQKKVIFSDFGLNYLMD